MASVQAGVMRDSLVTGLVILCSDAFHQDSNLIVDCTVSQSGEKTNDRAADHVVQEFFQRDWPTIDLNANLKDVTLRSRR
jgi:hypothetical protein